LKQTTQQLNEFSCFSQVGLGPPKVSPCQHNNPGSWKNTCAIVSHLSAQLLLNSSYTYVIRPNDDKASDSYITHLIHRT